MIDFHEFENMCLCLEKVIIPYRVSHDKFDPISPLNAKIALWPIEQNLSFSYFQIEDTSSHGNHKVEESQSVI